MSGKFFPSSDFFGRKSCFRNEKPLDELKRRHFQREESHRSMFGNSHIPGHCQNECCLTHGRSCSHNHQIRCLPPECNSVNPRKSRSKPAQSVFSLLILFNLFKSTINDCLYRLSLSLHILLGKGEHLVLSRIEKIVNRYAVIKRILLHLI